MKKRKVDVDVDEEELYNDQIKLSKKTNDKEKKKIEKKFGLNLLRQGAECGWEGHELVSVVLLNLFFSISYSCHYSSRED